MDKMTKIVLLVASFFTVLLVILSIVLFRDVSTSPPEVTIGSVLFKSAIFLMIAGVAGWWLSSKKVKHFFISMGYCLFVIAGLSWIWAEPLKHVPNLKKAIDVKMPNMSGNGFSWGKSNEPAYTTMMVETRGYLGQGECDAYVDEILVDGKSTDYLTDEQRIQFAIYPAYKSRDLMNPNFPLFKRSSFGTECDKLKLFVPVSLLSRIKVTATLEKSVMQ